MRLARFSVPLLWFALTTVPAFADVRVVAASGAPYTTIQAAVDAAVDGDLILVRPGTYGGFSVNAKSLDVVADTGGVVQIAGNVQVSTIGTTRTCTLNGVRIVGATGAPALRAAGCAGHVRLQGCDILGATLPACVAIDGPGITAWGQRATEFLACASVTISACQLQGGDGVGNSAFYSDAGFGADACYAENSHVALHGSTLVGGKGGDMLTAGCWAGYGYACAGMGGAGGTFVGCAPVFVSGTTFLGGVGGCSDSWCVGRSGSGLRTSWTPPLPFTQLYLLDSTATHGASVCPNTLSPDIELLGGGTLTNLPGQARGFTPSRVTREGVLARLRFEGQPGDRVELFYAPDAGFVLQLALSGVWGLRLRRPPLVAQVGTIGASGILDVAWVVGELGPGVSSVRQLYQPLFVDVTGAARLGPPAQLFLLDAAY